MNVIVIKNNLKRLALCGFITCIPFASSVAPSKALGGEVLAGIIYSFDDIARAEMVSDKDLAITHAKEVMRAFVPGLSFEVDEQMPGIKELAASGKMNVALTPAQRLTLFTIGAVKLRSFWAASLAAPDAFGERIALIHMRNHLSKEDAGSEVEMASSAIAELPIFLLGVLSAYESSLFAAIGTISAGDFWRAINERNADAMYYQVLSDKPVCWSSFDLNQQKVWQLVVEYTIERVREYAQIAGYAFMVKNGASTQNSLRVDNGVLL